MAKPAVTFELITGSFMRNKYVTTTLISDGRELIGNNEFRNFDFDRFCDHFVTMVVEKTNTVLRAKISGEQSSMCNYWRYEDLDFKNNTLAELESKMLAAVKLALSAYK